MKQIFIPLLMFWMVICSSSVFASTNDNKVTEAVIDSKILGENRKLVIYLPEGYHATKQSYPVLYITDGYAHGPHTAGSVDFLSKYDMAPKMIVVGVDNPREKRYRDLTVTPQKNAKANNVSGADRFLAYIEKEVIPYISSHFRTLDYKALAGTSHGGQFAINALIKRPGLFDGTIAVSPSLYLHQYQLIGATEAALKQQIPTGRLFVSISQDEPPMTQGYKRFVELVEAYPSDKLLMSSKVFTEENHDSTTLVGKYYGLKHLFADWAIASQPHTLAELKAVYKGRSELLGIEQIIPEDRANGYAQWLQYLGRKEDAIEMFEWNRKTYPHSFNTHLALIKVYSHFELQDGAIAAIKQLKQSNIKLTSEQKEIVESLSN